MSPAGWQKIVFSSSVANGTVTKVRSTVLTVIESGSGCAPPGPVVDVPQTHLSVSRNTKQFNARLAVRL